MLLYAAAVGVWVLVTLLGPAGFEGIRLDLALRLASENYRGLLVTNLVTLALQSAAATAATLGWRLFARIVLTGMAAQGPVDPTAFAYRLAIGFVPAALAYAAVLVIAIAPAAAAWRSLRPATEQPAAQAFA